MQLEYCSIDLLKVIHIEKSDNLMESRRVQKLAESGKGFRIEWKMKLVETGSGFPTRDCVKCYESGHEKLRLTYAKKQSINLGKF